VSQGCAGWLVVTFTRRLQIIRSYVQVLSSCASPLCSQAVGARDVGGRFLALVVLDGLPDQLTCSAAIAGKVDDFRAIERGIGWVPRIV